MSNAETQLPADAPLQDILDQTIVLIPAYNEEASIGSLIGEIRDKFPALPVLVINDGSQDHTVEVARRAGARVLNLPCNLGVSGAMQAGFRYVLRGPWSYVLRCDGDGQHPATSFPALLRGMQAGDADLVIGSRHIGEAAYKNTAMRSLGIGYLATFLSYICRCRVTDPTSGFQMYNRALVYYFAQYYPSEYPEPESLALVRRQGYTFKEVSCAFRARQHGVSSLNNWSAVYYAIKVTLALIVDRARSINSSFAKKHIATRMQAL